MPIPKTCSEGFRSTVLLLKIHWTGSAEAFGQQGGRFRLTIAYDEVKLYRGLK